MAIMGNKFLLKNFTIDVFAFLVMFLPRRLYFFGAFSYRIVILFVFVLCLILRKGKLSISNTIIDIPMILYFVIAGIISFVHLQFSTGLGYFIDTCLVLFMIYNLLQNEQDINKFINVFLLFLSIYAALGILECLTGFNIWDLVHSAGYQRYRFGLYRSYGSSTNFTNNGAFLMLCLPIVVWKMQQKEAHKKRYAVIYGLVLLNILATLTRSIILCTILLQFIWLLKSGMVQFIKKHFVQVMAAVTAVVLLVNIPVVYHFLNQFISMFVALYDYETANEISDSFGSNANGIGQRFLLYTWIFEAVKDKILFGLGPNCPFEYAFMTLTGKRMIKTSIENQYLVHLYRYGLAGLTSYLFMLTSIISRLWKNMENNLTLKGGKCTFGFMILTTAVIYFISGLSFAASDDFRMLFLILSLFFVHCQLTKRGEPENDELSSEI
ncbi:hypothetical protein DS742_23105 [Lacrimispora amygdalina]|uniref:O-antigen ligase-related domain-containing protein n=1 Tax=Lacrimispora amygdalina TaxID=253257 RepID=A0A3E2N6E6_9FIRM|nr:O-antigen ligase family protein [Clostridium indicum]RFZ76546.1 hypothetical protein DS742_23105 [Clostridium indicum]